MFVTLPWLAPGIDLRGTESDPRLRAVIELARNAMGSAPAHGATHAEQVAIYARAAGAAMGLAPSQCARLALCGLVHDVGKAAIPEEVLSKPGPLTVGEYEMMRRHPEIGAAILSMPELADVRSWTLCHHERPDGLGYPYGLMADEIPPEARILAVADAYAAMVEPRPYRPALSEWQACQELVIGAGTQFDAEVVSVFLRNLGAGRRQVERTA